MVVSSTGKTDNEMSTKLNDKLRKASPGKTNDNKGEKAVVENDNTLSENGSHKEAREKIEKSQVESNIIGAETNASEQDKSLPQNKSLRETQQFIQRSMDTFWSNSKLHFAKVPEITIADLEIGDTLGKGGFGLVKSAKWNGESYAFKTLLPSVISDESIFRVAASDLQKEAAFLSVCSHPHIIGIHAKRISMGEDLQDNFIVIDRLHESLTDRLKLWRKEDAALGKSVKKRRKLQLKGIEVSINICDALLYLHNQNIVFRDLKLSNVGFDHHGHVKIFDFGIAKELKDADKSNGKYKLSGNTGSLQYMAPEVAKNWKYDKMVDVYSFGILLWEIIALKAAFAKYETPEQMTDVWNGDERPPLEQWWPVELQWVMKKCWSYFAKSRPEFDVVKETLQEILDDDEDEEENHLRGVKSFRFGSRRSQKISVDANGGHSQRSHPHRPRHFFGKSSRRSSGRGSENESERSDLHDQQQGIHSKVSFDISPNNNASHKVPGRRKKSHSFGHRNHKSDSNQEAHEMFFLGNHSQNKHDKSHPREKENSQDKKAFFGLF